MSMQIFDNTYLSLSEYMEKEVQGFKKFIEPPLYVTEQEKEFLDSIAKFNEVAPGFIMYTFNESNMLRIQVLRSVLDRQPVNVNNNSRLFDIITTLCKNLGIPMPLVYVYSDEDIYRMERALEETSLKGQELFQSNNAFTCGSKEMLYVFISEELMAKTEYTDLEIMALIGHEIGHALANHPIKGSIMATDLSTITNPQVIARIKQLQQNNQYSRLQEITADRAAVIACRDAAAAQSMIKKMNNLNEALWDYDHSEASHPNGKTRAQAIELFGKSLLYARCIELIDHTTVDKSAYLLSARDLQAEIMKII